MTTHIVDDNTIPLTNAQRATLLKIEEWMCKEPGYEDPEAKIEYTFFDEEHDGLPDEQIVTLTRGVKWDYEIVQWTMDVDGNLAIQ